MNLFAFRMFSIVGFTIAAVVPSPVRADFALRDGDTVVFLGDSITAARTYGKIIENYTLLRFPDRKVRFVNAGWGGDTAAGGLARLDRDVFAHKATVVIVAYGVNDIGWGVHADDEHKKKYLDSVRGIVEQCKKRKVRVFICSAAVTAADPATSEDGFLQKMCDEGMAIARELGEKSIDVQRSMREVQKRVWSFNSSLKDAKGKETLHAADGVHLNNLGHLAMAWAILKGLGAPAIVSSATLDAANGAVSAAQGCRITAIKSNDGNLEFTRLDEGRPINFGLFGALQFRFVPIPQDLNQYELKTNNLPDGKYEVRADGRLLGTASNKQLAAGWNIASVTADAWQPGGPWDAEATILSRLTDARNELSVGGLLTNTYLSERTDRKALTDQMEQANAVLEDLQRSLVKPVPYRFVVRPAAEKK